MAGVDEVGDVPSTVVEFEVDPTDQASGRHDGPGVVVGLLVSGDVAEVISASLDRAN